ncbi:unnamed protein product [Urochloa humidicola]
MEPRRRALDGLPSEYGSSNEVFSVEIHHSGFFCGIGMKRIYVSEQVDWFDHCNNDTWSLLYVEDFLKQLGIVFAGRVRVYWCLPNKVSCRRTPTSKL